MQAATTVLVALLLSGGAALAQTPVPPLLLPLPRPSRARLRLFNHPILRTGLLLPIPKT